MHNYFVTQTYDTKHPFGVLHSYPYTEILYFQFIDRFSYYLRKRKKLSNGERVDKKRLGTIGLRYHIDVAVQMTFNANRENTFGRQHRYVIALLILK